MKNKLQNNRQEYSITGFYELISSPFFFSIIVLTIVLGLASTFGFFKNPRKLKLIIDLISQRIFISEVDRKIMPKIVVSNRAYFNSLAQKELQLVSKKDGNITASSLDKSRYAIFSEDFSLEGATVISKDAMESVSIDYNISSKRFWGGYSLNGFSENHIIGTSISPYHSLEKDLSKYNLSLNHFTL